MNVCQPCFRLLANTHSVDEMKEVFTIESEDLCESGFNHATTAMQLEHSRRIAGENFDRYAKLRLLAKEVATAYKNGPMLKFERDRLYRAIEALQEHLR